MIDRVTHTAKAKAAFDRIFSSGDPYDKPFQPDVERRTILFPTESYALDRSQFDAVRDAALTVLGENVAFRMDVEQWPAIGWNDDIRELWMIRLDDFDTYLKPPSEANIVLMQNALFSTHGRWGLTISDEDHAPLGGPAEFVERVLDSLEVSEAQMIGTWLEHWRDNALRFGSDTRWLRPQLEHLYGSERANELLLEE